MTMNSRFATQIAKREASNERAPGTPKTAAESYLDAARFRRLLTRASFIILVIVPTFAATIFYGLVAAPRYASDARFIVRSLSAPQTTGLDMIFRTFGLAKTVDDAYVVQKYLLSKDAMIALSQRGIDLKAIFAKKGADYLSRYPRFWRGETIESLHDYYLDHVTVSEDSVKGIIDLQVVAFSPEDANLIATTLIKLSEEMVNRMNDRAQQDSLVSAQNEVDRAEESVISAQARITDYRDKQMLLDPKNTSKAILLTVGELSTDLSFTTAQLNEMQKNSPNNPAISTLKAKVAALQDRIKAERGKLVGTDDSLSNKLSAFEEFSLKRDLADKSLANALNSLENARHEARRQHIYLEQVVSANLPDESTEPQRLRGILTIFVLGFGLFSVVWILSVGAGEHAQ